MPRITSPAALLLATLLHGGLAQALPEDRNQPVELEADRVEYDEQSGTSTYIGHVVVVQGSLRTEADRVTVYSENDEVVKVVATGRPARFRQRPHAERQEVRGKGERIEYQAAGEQVVLSGNAELEQEGSVVRSQRIVYDGIKGMATAGASPTTPTERQPSGGERVRITIQPKKER